MCIFINFKMNSHKNKQDLIIEDKEKKSESNQNPLNHTFITLESLANVLVANNLSEIEYEESGRRIYLSRKIDIEQKNISNLPQVANQGSVQEEKSVVEQEQFNWKNHLGAIRSPMVGVAYVSPEPGAEPFVRVGDSVNSGQTLLIIEAMKVLNPIKASKSGKVMAIFVHDQKPVEYDEPLIVISE